MDGFRVNQDLGPQFRRADNPPRTAMIPRLHCQLDRESQCLG